MTDTPLISIIIPCYNLEDYIRKTLQSVLEQTYLNLEIILVDDGSTDKTAEIIDELKEKDSRIKVIHKENGGVTSARLEGIKIATGEWIGFVDGDDYVEPEMYEKLLQNAVKYNADISHCGYQMVFPSRVDYYYNTEKIICQDNVTGIEDLLNGKFVEPALGNKLYHKFLFPNVLRQMKKYVHIEENEDLLMNYFLFFNAKQSIFEDVCYYHYVLRKGSATTGTLSAKKHNDVLEVLQIIKKENKNNDIEKIIDCRLTAKQINILALKIDKNDSEFIELKNNSKKELKNSLPLLNRGENKRLLFMAKLVIFSPPIYNLIHSIYSKIKGTKYKYNIE